MRLPRLSHRVVLAACAALSLPALACAHPGHEGHDFGWDFTGGVLHPLTGLDHLFAMVAVGVWAARLGGKARWALPAAFVATMALTAALARAGVMIPGVEQGIAASILVLGLLVVTARKMPLSVGLGLTALFASFHGLAHGAEIPDTASGLLYGAGFVVATAALHAVGLGLGMVWQRLTRRSKSTEAQATA